MSAATKPCDGQQAAIDLLLALEKLNWNRDAPVKSRKEVEAVLKVAASFRDEEFSRFADVIAKRLVGDVLGFPVPLEAFVASMRATA